MITPYLQAGFGEPIGHDLLVELRDRFGIRGIRQDLQGVHDQALGEALIQEILDADLGVLAILSNLTQVAWLSQGCHAEWRNERDGDQAPADYADEARLFVAECHRWGVLPWVGAISNIDKDSLRWLELVLMTLPTSLPPFGVSVHHYAHGSRIWDPHPGFSSVEAQVWELQRLAGGRPIFVTEMGFSTAPRNPVGKWAWLLRLLGKKEQWSDQQVAQFLHERWGFWESYAVAACTYQLNDGPNPNAADDRYGIRRLDGRWKPSAQTFPR